MALHWTRISPANAVDIVLPQQGIIGPLAEDGDPCPWPWDPQQLRDAPFGMYHCPYCGSMALAGVHHPHYLPDFTAHDAEKETNQQ